MKDSQKKATLQNKIDFAVVISVKNAVKPMTVMVRYPMSA